VTGDDPVFAVDQNGIGKPELPDAGSDLSDLILGIIWTRCLSHLLSSASISIAHPG